jgi:hypothetical protein
LRFYGLSCWGGGGGGGRGEKDISIGKWQELQGLGFARFQSTQFEMKENINAEEEMMLSSVIMGSCHDDNFANSFFPAFFQVLTDNSCAVSVNVVKFVRREKRQLLLHHPNTAALLATSATTNGSLPHKDEKGNDQPASMMEQLVPEIMQHTLSYLDYRSLCNMSMTCSVLRRVANDDSVWKAVFHKVSS